jgi:hypothetical protein
MHNIIIRESFIKYHFSVLNQIYGVPIQCPSDMQPIYINPCTFNNFSIDSIILIIVKEYQGLSPFPTWLHTVSFFSVTEESI